MRINDSLEDMACTLMTRCCCLGGHGTCWRSLDWLGRKGRTHRPVVGLRWPVYNFFLLKQTSHVSSSYLTLHPASHSVLINMRLVCASPGTICAILAVNGSHGMSNRHVYIDFVVPPSGKLIVSGCCVDCTFVTSALGSRKCTVAPASAITMLRAI